mmetsp:Transcript_21133/g.39269  ORF Transcript_21133/g.39269 Transcript_21133/m.39269 type:complete len:795 (+) Transcript_21133:292-2676(+)
MDDVGTGTSSGDQDERIRIRRQRIEKRNLSKSEEGSQSQNTGPEEQQQSRRKQQVASSLVKLDKTKASSIQLVTSIRVEADHAENSRRILEEEKRQRRLHNLQGEAVFSGKKNAAVEMRWAELMEYNMPLELNQEVLSQKKACDGIIASKDKLISDFQRELKIKDEEYVKALKRQGEDIEQILTRMGKQYKELQQQYEEELEAIEEAFLQERKELIENNRGEIDSLFEKRRVMEMNYMEARQEREANYQQELTELRTRDAEDYNQLKIKLETDIQTLEQQLEEMRATYQLNTEKLEYNYRVLTERDMENSATLGQQKRKLARLKDALSSLTTKYHNTDSKYKQENMELTEEYRRITKQYKDLQSKFRHFEIADIKKYMSIWDMHREEVLEQVNKLLAADRIITEQQLGLQWVAPNPKLFECHSGMFTSTVTSKSSNSTAQRGQDEKASEQAISAVQSSTSNSTAIGITTSSSTTTLGSISESSCPRQGKVQGNGGEAGKDSDDANSKLSGATAPGNEGHATNGPEKNSSAASPAVGPHGTALEELDFLTAAAYRSKVKAAKVKRMIELLCAEANFLIDPAVRDTIKDDKSDAANGEAAVSILKALSVETEGDMSSLLGFFYEKVDDDEEDAFALERAFDKESETRALGLLVKPDQVVKVIRQFVNERSSTGENDPTKVQTTRRKKRDDRLDEEQRASDARRERDRLEEIEYWSRLVDVVPDRTIRVWEALEQALERYNGVLVERAASIQQVASLRSQNDELKGLLNQYLESDVVKNLVVPPLDTTTPTNQPLYR